MTNKMSDPDSWGPVKVEDDPWAELFADCKSVDDVMELVDNIARMERRERPE